MLTYGDDDLVLVVLGDHQPASIVSGADAGRDVPVTIISKDPAVLDAMMNGGDVAAARRATAYFLALDKVPFSIADLQAAYDG